MKKLLILPVLAAILAAPTFASQQNVELALKDACEVLPGMECPIPKPFDPTDGDEEPGALALHPDSGNCWENPHLNCIEDEQYA